MRLTAASFQSNWGIGGLREIAVRRAHYSEESDEAGSLWKRAVSSPTTAEPLQHNQVVAVDDFLIGAVAQ